MEGFGGGRKSPSASVEIPPEASEAMQRAAVTEIAAKAGSNLPVIRGRDVGLPAASPVFDIEELSRRSKSVSARLQFVDKQ